MKLLIDIGNTHTHIGYWHSSRVINCRIIKTESLLKNLDNLSYKSLEDIYLVSVISPEKHKRILKKLASYTKTSITEIRSSKKFMGVTNGYINPRQLGNDRWACIVGLSLKYKKSLCIVDCGTAISIDFVKNRLKHAGGYILSGFSGYSSSFSYAHHLKNLKLFLPKSNKKKFTIAKSTREAILEGYSSMIISTVEKSYKEFSASQIKKPILIIGGGYGETVSKRISIRNIYEPNLVLKSLGSIANHS